MFIFYLEGALGNVAASILQVDSVVSGLSWFVACLIRIVIKFSEFQGLRASCKTRIYIIEKTENQKVTGNIDFVKFIDHQSYILEQNQNSHSH